MFEQSLIQSSGKTRKFSTVILSTLIQIGLIIVAIIVPMIYYEVLPGVQLTSFLVPPPPPPPPPPPAEAPPPVEKIVKVIPRQFDAGRLIAPKEVPKEIAVIREDELPPPAPAVGVVGAVGGLPGGSMGGVLGGILGSVGSAASAPPPPPPPPPPTRVRVGGNVQAAKLIRQPKPVYPPLARQARISGVVHFTAIIGKDGTIQNLQLISGHPLLVAAAQQAVSQWVYEPTLLNDQPVEVITQIDVNFTLTQ